jgi:iron complex transport system ATP-binding protein
LGNTDTNRTGEARGRGVVIETENLHFSYTEGVPVLRGVSLGIKRGTVTTMLGANACGKTTLLRLLTKDLSPSSGRVLLGGGDIRHIKRREFARLAAIVHQKNAAPDDLTVRRLTAYGRLPHGGLFRAGSVGDKEAVERALSRAGLSDIADTPVGTLSGGQRQRAFIAMALAQDTEILFLDEPTTFLDVRYQTEILTLVRELNEKHGVTVVMVLHDINQALLYSDEIIGLADGKVFVHGPPGEAINPDSIQLLYGVSLDVREDRDSGRKWVLPVPPAGGKYPRPVGPTREEQPNAEQQTEPDRKKGKATLMKKIIKPFFIALGFVSLGLGAVGVVLPILPTTPFLLLTAFCFARGSERFHRWFMGTKLYKNHIDDFVRTKSMPVKTKASILTAVSILLPLAMYFVPYPHARILMGAVLAWHWWYFLFRVKTVPASAGAGDTDEAGGKNEKKEIPK